MVSSMSDVHRGEVIYNGNLSCVWTGVIYLYQKTTCALYLSSTCDKNSLYSWEEGDELWAGPTKWICHWQNKQAQIILIILFLWSGLIVSKVREKDYFIVWALVFRLRLLEKRACWIIQQRYHFHGGLYSSLCGKLEPIQNKNMIIEIRRPLTVFWNVLCFLHCHLGNEIWK